MTMLYTMAMKFYDSYYPFMDGLCVCVGAYDDVQFPYLPNSVRYVGLILFLQNS